MRQRREMTRGGARRIDREVARSLDGRLPGIGIGEQEAGERPCERRLADPFGTADQPGVGEPPLAVSSRAARPRRSRGRSAAGRDADAAPPGRRRFRVDRRPPGASSLTPRRAGWSKSRLDHGPDRGLDLDLGLQRIDHRATRRLHARDVEEGAAQHLMEGDPLALEPVSAASPASQGRPFEPDPGGNVEDQRQVGPVRADRDLFEAGDERGREVARGALIGAGRNRRSGR